MGLAIRRQRTLLEALGLVIQHDLGKISTKIATEDTRDILKGALSSLKGVYRYGKSLALQTKHEGIRASVTFVGKDILNTSKAIKNSPKKKDLPIDNPVNP